MRVGQSNTARFFLICDQWNKGQRFQVEDLEEYETTFADTHKLKKGGYYSTDKAIEVTLGALAYDYLFAVFSLFGTRCDVRFITEVKDEKKPSEDWLQISNVGVDLTTLEFFSDTEEVKFKTTTGGFINEIEARWGDEFDITKDNPEGLNFVQVHLEPRRILSKSKFVASDIEVNFKDDLGSTVRSLPLSTSSPGYSSQHFVGSVLNVIGGSVNNTYARLGSQGTIITDAPHDYIYTFNGTVEIEITQGAFGGFMNLDLVRYNNGITQDFDEVILGMDVANSIVTGTKLSYTFQNYKVQVKAGDSIGIMTISQESFSAQPTYKITNSTNLRIQTDTPYKDTYTKAIRLKDAFQKLVGLASGFDDITVNMPSFNAAGGYTETGEVLLVHGSWLRNMPYVLNEGEEDERRIQCNLSLKKLYGACKIVKPLYYGPRTVNTKKYLDIGLETETEQNFVGVDLTSQEVSPKFKAVAPNIYGKVTIGSNTSGNNHEVENNLYSICGRGTWNTFNRKSDKKYEVLTDFRTSCEDVEKERQFQYDDYPGRDTEMQDDWFFIHAKQSGNEYKLVRWPELYIEQPKNVYDATSCYNWMFSPRRLFDGHGYKIKPCLNNRKDDFVAFSGSNCNASLITRKTGEDEKPEDGRIYHNTIDKGRISLLQIEFDYVVRQSVINQLNGSTNSIDNRFGLIAFKLNGEHMYGRLIEVDTNKKGKFKLIQAVR